MYFLFMHAQFNRDFKINMAESGQASEEAKSKRKNFKWTPKMIEDLINSIDLYKASMEYKNLDFDSDKAAQYSWVREAMAEIYKEENEAFFGPVKQPILPQEINKLCKEGQIKNRRSYSKSK